MFLKFVRATNLAVSLVSLPTLEGARGNKILQGFSFPFALTTYFAVVLRNSAPVYLTIAQSKRGFFRDAFVIWLAVLFGHPVVCHLHGGNYDGFFAQQPRILQWLIRRSLIEAQTVIILSERLRSMFRFEPAIASRLRVVPNGLPLGLSGSSVTKCLPANPETPIQILYLSNLIESKGYFDLLRAIALLVNRYKLNVVGHFCGSFVGVDGGSAAASVEDAQRGFLEFIQGHGLEARVQFHGPVHGTDKAAFLTSAHILVLPTNYQNEGQPISIIEALAYGTVVVSTAYRAIPDLVVEGVTGRLVPFGDPARLAEVLAEIAGDPNAYRRMSSAAYQLYQSSYTGRAHVAALLELLCTTGASAASSDLTTSVALHEGDDGVLERRVTRTAQYFSQMAGHWTAKYTLGGQFKERLSRLLTPLSAAVAPPARVLDFGSGSGVFAETLCDAGYDVWALDSSSEMARCCRELLAGTSARFLEPCPAEWSRIETPDCWFDAIVASSVLEYVGQVEPQLNEFFRALRVGGIVLFTVPNGGSFSRCLEHVLRPAVICKAIDSLQALMPARLQEYRRYLEFSINRWPLEKWADVLRQSGFENIQIQGGRAALALITARRAGSRGNGAPVTFSLERFR